jgi:hypothetical protein
VEDGPTVVDKDHARAVDEDLDEESLEAEASTDQR